MFRQCSVMGLSRDQLIFMGLVALDEVVEDLDARSYRPRVMIRAVLAMLHALSDADAQVFVDFWRICHAPVSEVHDQRERCRQAKAQFHRICRALRIDLDIAMMADLAAARRKPSASDAVYQARQRRFQTTEAAGRQAFAERLRRRAEAGSIRPPAPSPDADDPAPSGRPDAAAVK